MTHSPSPAPATTTAAATATVPVFTLEPPEVIHPVPVEQAHEPYASWAKANTR